MKDALRLFSDSLPSSLSLSPFSQPPLFSSPLSPSVLGKGSPREKRSLPTITITVMLSRPSSVAAAILLAAASASAASVSSEEVVRTGGRGANEVVVTTSGGGGNGDDKPTKGRKQLGDAQLWDILERESVCCNCLPRNPEVVKGKSYCRNLSIARSSVFFRFLKLEEPRSRFKDRRGAMEGKGRTTLAVPEQLSCPRLSPSLLSGMLLPLHDGNPIFLRPPPRRAAATHARFLRARNDHRLLRDHRARCGSAARSCF